MRLQGRALTREQAPLLFAEIDAIRDKLQVRKRMEVMLDDSFNAGALETRGFFGLFGTRRVLFLGVPLLENLVPLHPTYRVPVYRSLADYYARTDSDESERWRARLDGALKRRVAAIASFTSKMERGRANAITLSPDAQTVLFNAIALDLCVERARLLYGCEPLATAEATHAADLDIHALVLTLDPKILEQTGQDEDTERQRYFGALRKLVGVDAAIAVQSYFTTQALPAAIGRCPRLLDRRAAAPG